MSFTNYGGTLCEWNPADYTTDGPFRRAYPFEGSLEYYVEQDYLQLRSSFVELALSQEHPTMRGYYLVRQSPPQAAGGAICKFTLTWAPIFKPRREMEPYSYTIPGITNDGEWTENLAISGASLSNGRHYITTSTAHGFAAPVGATPGTGVIITYWVVDTVGNWSVIYGRSVFREVLEVPSSTQFGVYMISDIGPITWSSCYKNVNTRKPRSRVVPSFIHYDYWLPGVSVGIAEVDDIDILQPTKILDATGNETESYSDTTTPTASEYRAQVARQEYVVAEPSNIRPVFGNLYERSTRYVVAI